MHMLKKDTKFVWDHLEQCAFKIIKHAITHAPLLQPLNYTNDYSLYAVVSLTTCWVL